jgi:hypothetical protein
MNRLAAFLADAVGLRGNRLDSRLTRSAAALPLARHPCLPRPARPTLALHLRPVRARGLGDALGLAGRLGDLWRARRDTSQVCRLAQPRSEQRREQQ